jgi:hypothetical protein
MIRTIAAFAALLLSACPGPGANVDPPYVNPDLDPAMDGEWLADVSLSVPEELPIEYSVYMLLLVDGDKLTVAGLCPGNGRLFTATSTTPTSASWAGTFRCNVERPGCPGAEVVFTSVAISLADSSVTGVLEGRLESRCSETPVSVAGSLSAIRSR